MIPDWAGFFTEARYAHFMQIVREVFRSEGIVAQIDETAGTWREADLEREFALVNLAQICNQAPLDNWRDHAEHFIRTMRLDFSREAENERPEEIFARLRVRLYPPESMDHSQVVKVMIADGLLACLALDYPDHISTLNRDLARTLGKSSDELFDLGLANVRANVQPTLQTNQLPNGTVISSFIGDDFFTGTLALVVHDLLPPEPTHGYLVAIPNRHEFMAVRLDSKGSLQALGFLAHFGRELFQQGPGSISPYVYWVKNGRWARVELEQSERGIGLIGPDAFLDEIG